MNKKVQICHAGQSDIYRIAAFLDNCWKAEYRYIVSADYLNTMSVEARYEGLLKRYDEGASDFMMMLDGSALIGAAVYGKSFTEGYEEDGEISAIYLHENYIGRGYGHQLCLKIEHGLCSKGFANYVLDVLTGNIRAVRFYQGHGYEKVADRSIRLGEVDYPLSIMRKVNG